MNIAVGLLIFIICGIPSILTIVFLWFMRNDALSMGITGFIQAIITRLLWIMTAIVVVIGIKKRFRTPLVESQYHQLCWWFVFACMLFLLIFLTFQF